MNKKQRVKRYHANRKPKKATPRQLRSANDGKFFSEQYKKRKGVK
jgi:hypothetical protein